MTEVAVIAIGRNEGVRLQACLDSLAPQCRHLIYVDSGSVDDSLARARRAGAHVIELDTSMPFTAARARNAGFAALADLPDTEQITLVHFIDGDCAVEAGWIARARSHMLAHDRLGILTGWRREIHPEASIYNRLCDVEWHRPAGPITACGGDMMVRRAAFDKARGFNPTVIAAEDDEFCQRIAKAGWDLERLPEQMTRHDANMLRFGQWWRRAERSGHGFAQVASLHPGYFAPERKRVLLYAFVLPLLALAGLLVFPPLLALVVLAYVLSYWRTLRGLGQSGISGSDKYRLAALLSLSKFPNLIGMGRFWLRRMRGSAMRLIEYK